VGVPPPFVSGSRGCEPSGDGASAGVQQAAHVQEEQKAAEPVGGVRTEPNPYEDSPCQEINYPYERFFSFFSAFRVPVLSALGLVL
jgi:hypothetical protein